jgi:hypothetical protein
MTARAVPIYPPEVRDQAWYDLKDTGEPPLWTPGALGHFHRRIRLSIAGISSVRVVVRLDQRADGSALGRITQGAARNLAARRFHVPADRMAHLDELVRDAGLWTIYPEFYALRDKDAICLDGEALAFERVDSDGYRFSQANAQCDAPKAVLIVAQELLGLAHAKQAAKLLE